MEDTQKPYDTSSIASQTGRPTIGLLTRGVAYPGHEALWAGVVEACRTHTAHLITISGGLVRPPDRIVAQANIGYDLVNHQTFDGLLIWFGRIGWYLTDEERVQFCRRYQPLPCVSIEERIPGIPSVLKENLNGMRAAVTHLIQEHGCRKIAFLQGPGGVAWADERYRAYEEALMEAGLPLEPHLIVPHSEARDASGMEIAGYVQLRMLLDERGIRPGCDVDAIVSVNDYYAWQVMTELQARGLHVPHDLAVIGFDDDQESRVLTPPLTTVQNPMYAMGKQAVKLVVEHIQGKPVPEQVVVSAPLIIRQSCGCPSLLIQSATLGNVTEADEPFEIGTTVRRDNILPKLRDSIRELGVNDIPDDVLVSLLKACLTAIQTSSSKVLLSALEAFLYQVLQKGRDPVTGQLVLSALRRQVTPFLTAKEVTHAKDLWIQAHIMVGEVGQRVEAYHRVQTEKQGHLLREIGAKLITTFAVDMLMDALAGELPRLGIRGCYLALYEGSSGEELNPSGERESPSGKRGSSSAERKVRPYPYSLPVPEWSRLILAYSEAGRLEIPPAGQRFLSCDLRLSGLLPLEDRSMNLLLLPLYFQEQQIGFVLLEPGTCAGNVYEALQVQISSALQGDLLVQRVQEHAAEVIRKNYILDTFMETVPDSIYFKDRENRFLQANTALAQLLGVHEPANLVGKTDFDFFPEEQAQRKYEQEQDIIRTGTPVLTVEESDARGRWTLTTKMPLRNEHGDIIGIFGISRDITHLKNTEHELLKHRHHLEDLVKERTSEITRVNTCLRDEIFERERIESALRTGEQQYRMLAENVKDGVIIVQEGTIVFTNEAFASMLGYSVDLLLHSNPATLFSRHTEHGNSSLPISMESYAESSEPPRQIELMTRDDRTIWVEIEQSDITWNTRPAILLTIRNINQSKLRELRLEEERARLRQENLLFKSTIGERFRFGELIGKSPAMQRVYELIISAASSGVNVLVYGESGTGKELIARTIHQVSPRKDRAFVPVNCASIPETLFEREFFGHRKGAFTGADRDHPGFFDRAHRGILFLDEVTELSPGMQAKLLRVLQDGEYIPLGSNITKQADVLIIAATNKNCRDEITAGRLRQDFFYRIGVIEMTVPPLRERKEDLPLLIEHILVQYRQKQAGMHGTTPQNLPLDQTMLPGELAQALYAYVWPGNIRELQNILQRYIATTDLSSVLSLIVAPEKMRAMAEIPLHRDGVQLSEIMQAVEKRILADVLQRHQYHTGKAAKQLGITRRALQKKIVRFQISRETDTL